MTSREVTPFLPLGRSEARGLTNWAVQIGFGAITWPWLLRSLWGGRRRDRAALLTRLGLPEAALPHLGSWKADVGFLTRLADHVAAAQPAVVVELGAGASTLILARALALNGGGRLVSYDQHAPFVAATRAWLAEQGVAAEVRHAPLSDPPAGWPGRWYALADVPERIDMLVIDGPPWTLHPLVRGGAEVLFDRIAPGGVVMLDDAARPGERIVARRWKRRWPGFDWRLHPGIKGTLVGRRR